MKRGLVLTIAFIVLMVGLIAGSPVCFSAYTGTATYDYYVVAGYGMVPTPPSPGSSPSGFLFSCTPSVYNFGNITFAGSLYYPGQWLYHTAGVKVDITNVFGLDVTIRNLTAEVIAGTPTIDFVHPGSGRPYGNFTLVGFEALDPGIDECNYLTDNITLPLVGDQDEYVKAVGTVYPASFGKYTGSMSLMLPDSGGDAASTNHVAPRSFTSGSTFREYFGVRIFGNATWGTRIDGTIRLTLIYEYTVPSTVGGISVAIDKVGLIVPNASRVELIAPYIGLAILLVSIVITLVYTKKRKKQ